MFRVCFKRGMVFLEGPINWVLERVLPDHRFQFVSEEGKIKNCTENEVHEKYLKSEWTIDKDSLSSSANSIYLCTPRDLSTYSTRQQKVALRKQEYIKAVDPKLTPYNVTIWQSRILEFSQKIGDINPPCTSTVHTWWMRYRVGKDVNSLIPQNNGRKTPNKTHRYALFMEAVDKVFLTREQQPKSAVFEEVEKLIDRLNAGVHEDELIKCPARSTIYCWLDDLRKDVLDNARLGPDAAKLKYRTVNHPTQKLGLLERIEIDHTPIDLIIIDDKTGKPLGRAWLTMAIECASRIPMGFYIGLHTPSAYSIIQCLRRAILPKSLWLQRYPCEGQWPAYGIPDKIFVDNGMDFHSGALASACQELGIELVFCPAKGPQFKGKIERFFGTMNTGLFHRLPGTTKSNTIGRGDYESEERAVLCLDDLIKVTTKYLVDIYIRKPHSSLGGVTPFDKWHQIKSKRIIEFPLHPVQVELIGGKSGERMLFHYGIELDSLYYNSSKLQELRRKIGNEKISLKFYEETVDHIDVFDPRERCYFRVHCIDREKSFELSREIYKLINERARKLFGNSCTKSHWQIAREQIEEIVEKARLAKRMASRKKAHATVMVSSETLLAQRDPFAELSKQAMDAEPPAMPVDAGLEDDLPIVDTFDMGVTA